MADVPSLCWRCRIEPIVFWLEIALAYAFVAGCGFLAGAVHFAGTMSEVLP